MDSPFVLRFLSTLLLASSLLAGCAADVAPSPSDALAADKPLAAGAGGKADEAGAPVRPVVGPLLSTLWGQSGRYQSATPKKDGERTYPGCTTLASAQILYYYRWQDHAGADVCYGLEHAPLSGPDVTDGDTLCVTFAGRTYDWDAMSVDLTSATRAQITATSEFIYHVGVTLNAQFGGGEGSSATGRQIENAFRYQWGYDQLPRREMTVISKDAFGYDDAEWADVMRRELDAGRPVMILAQQRDADAGHAFVVDGYAEDGRVHVNWGWGGYGNGWVDPATFEDPSGRRWSRDAMLFLGLEPERGYAAAMRPAPAPAPAELAWNGNGSLISLASGTRTGYGLTIDEAAVHASSPRAPVVFFQWEIDGRDGRRLRVSAEGATRATITYGAWSERGEDRVYRDVPLPFVLDPARDGKSTADGEYYVLAVAFAEGAPDASVVVEPTTAAASAQASLAATPVRVDGHVWDGNGSLISLASGTATGYGLTLDEARIHPTGEAPPVVFFQWELDQRDGRKLELAAEGMERATITYGTWDDRGADVTREVTLPHVIDPAADGRATADGTYYVLRVAFASRPATARSVVATIVR